MIYLFLLLLCFNTEAKVYDRQNLRIADDWRFLTKFCFAKSGGEAKIYLNTSQETLYFQAFHDGNSSWNAFDHNDCETSKDYGTTWLAEKQNEENFKWFEYVGQRPRWWFYTLANCEERLIDVNHIRIELTNPGGFFREQFSADLWGIPEMVICFTVASLIIIGLCGYFMNTRRLPNAQYNLFKWLTCTTFCQTIGLLLLLIHIFVYATDGIGLVFLIHIAVVLCIMSHVSFYFIGMMIARGYGASEVVNLTFDHTIIYGCALLFLVECLCYLWYNFSVHESSVVDPVETWPSWILCSLSILAFFYLTYHTVFHTLLFTITDDSKKFYFQFITLFGIWVFSFPLLMFITSAVAAHFRAKVVFGMEFSTLLCFEFGLVYLFSGELPFRSSIDAILQKPVLEEPNLDNYGIGPNADIAMMNLSPHEDNTTAGTRTCESP